MSERHQEAFEQLRFAHWRDLADGQSSLALAQSNVRNDETGHNNRGIVCLGKARPDEFEQLGLSVANNAHPTFDDFLECSAVQESLDLLAYLVDQSPVLGRIVTQGWEDVMGSEVFMHDEYIRYQNGSETVQGLTLSRWCFDHGICEQSIMENGKDEMVEDQDEGDAAATDNKNGSTANSTNG